MTMNLQVLFVVLSLSLVGCTGSKKKEDIKKDNPPTSEKKDSGSSDESNNNNSNGNGPLPPPNEPIDNVEKKLQDARTENETTASDGGLDNTTGGNGSGDSDKSADGTTSSDGGLDNTTGTGPGPSDSSDDTKSGDGGYGDGGYGDGGYGDNGSTGRRSFPFVAGAYRPNSQLINCNYQKAKYQTPYLHNQLRCSPIDGEWYLYSFNKSASLLSSSQEEVIQEDTGMKYGQAICLYTRTMADHFIVNVREIRSNGFGINCYNKNSYTAVYNKTVFVYPGEAIAYQYRGANDLARTFFAYFSRETEGYMPASACNRTTLRNVVSLYDSGRQIFGDDVVGSGGYDDGSSSSNNNDTNGVIVSDSGTYDDNTVPNQGHVTSQQPAVIVDQSSQGTTTVNPPVTVSTNVPKSNFTGIVFPEMTCKSMNPGSMGFRVELGKDEEGTSKVAVFKDFGFGIESLIDVRPASVEQRKSFPLRRCKSWINYAFEDSRNDLDLDFKTPKKEDGSRSMKADFRLKSESEFYQYKGELECQMTPDFLERRKRCLEL